MLISKLIDGFFKGFHPGTVIRKNLPDYLVKIICFTFLEPPASI